MNPYRSRSPNSAVNRIAVAFVVLIALGAILASILLGPKPNATVVMMQPIRPAATSEEAPNPLATPTDTASSDTATSSDAAPNDAATSSDPLASVPTDQLPVIQSQPTQPATAEPKAIEQSELGVDVSATNSNPTDAGSSAQPSSNTQSDSSGASALAAGVQGVTPASQTNPSAASSSATASGVTAPNQTSDTPTKPATVTASANPRTAPSSSAVRPVPRVAAPDPAPSTTSSAATSGVPRTTTSSAVSTTTSSVKPTAVASAPTASATPRRTFLRRATNGVSVQVVALSNLDAAAKLAQNLAANGFTANVQPSGSVYRVVIGPYANEAAAQTAAARATGFFR
jgi:SPOR domain